MACPHCAVTATLAASFKLVTVGNPNTGKSTLINTLSGANLQVGNWPGTTVERLEAHLHHQQAGVDRGLTLVDLPGAYTLAATSPEERLTCQELLLGGCKVINVLDAGNLERNLHLTLELTEFGLPMLVALNLMDEAKAKGLSLDPQTLERALGVPVVPTIASRKKETLTLLERDARLPEPAVRYPSIIEEAVAAVTQHLEHPAKRWLALAALMGEEVALPKQAQQEVDKQCEALERAGIDAFLTIEDARYVRARELAQLTLVNHQPTRSLTERIDRVVLHPLLGLPLFLASMLLVFRFTFLFSDPWIAFIETVQEVLSAWVAALALPSLLQSFLGGALIGGVGTVLVFTPVLFFLYVAMSFLEMSGFLARAAFIADRLMQLVGLPGRAFIPMLLGLGCNVPAIYATRTLEHFPDRLRTAMAIPFVSCSARLPVFVLLAAVFFPAQATLVVFGLYLLGLLVGLMTIWLLKHAYRGEGSSGVMELPPYRLPSLSLILRQAKARTMSFVRGAGGPILVGVVLVWALLNLPAGDADGSLYASASSLLMPVFLPLEIDDWRLVGALVPGFVAKEVVVGALGASFLGAEVSEALGWLEGLSVISNDFWSSVLATLGAVPALFGLPVLELESDAPSGLSASLTGTLSTAGAVAYLVFVLLYTPCIATIGALRQEFGRRWATFAVLYGVGVAYLMAFLASRLVGWLG